MKLFTPEHYKLAELRRQLPLPFLTQVQIQEFSFNLVALSVVVSDKKENNHYFQGTSEGVVFNSVIYHRLKDRKTGKNSMTFFEVRFKMLIDWNVMPWAKVTEGLMVSGVTRDGSTWINPYATKLFMLLLRKILPNADLEYGAGTFPMCGRKSYLRYAKIYVKSTIENLKSANVNNRLKM